MPKLKFSHEKKKKIKQAVAEAESKTSGEIATAFIKQSDNYAVYELTFAVMVGLAYFIAIMFFAHSIEDTIKRCPGVFYLSPVDVLWFLYVPGHRRCLLFG